MTQTASDLLPEVQWMLARAPIPCWLCGDLVHTIVSPSGFWAWADESGSVTGHDRDLRHLYAGGSNPYAHLASLAARCKTSPSAIFEYSALKVRLDAGGTFHVHDVRSADKPAYPEHFPHLRHCHYPAWLRPSGWQCRICERWLDGQPRPYR